MTDSTTTGNSRSPAYLIFKRTALAVSCFFVLMVDIVLPAFSADLPKAQGDILLSITGKVANSNSETGIEIDKAMIESLPVTTFSTETPWTDGDPEWSGVRLSDILDYVGAESNEFHATALDGYEVIFKGVDLEKYPVIIAYKKNDEYMSVRDLGPLWIMFPFADHPEINIQVNRSLCVWQLRKIEVL